MFGCKNPNVFFLGVNHFFLVNELLIIYMIITYHRILFSLPITFMKKKKEKKKSKSVLLSILNACKAHTFSDSHNFVEVTCECVTFIFCLLI